MASQIDRDWQSTKQTVLERSCHMFNNPLMSDIMFTCDESKSKYFYAHKYVLATSSAVFYAMFYGDLAENESCIHLPDAEDESFEEFLRFLYTDQCNLTPEIAQGVMYLAKKYIVPSLSQECSAMLLENVTSENVFLLLELSMQFSEKELEQKCWSVIDTNVNAAISSEAIVHISQPTLGELLKRDTLKIKEVNLYKAVLKWADFQCLENGMKITHKNRRTVLGDALHQIRFLSMTEAEFTHEVSSSELLTPEESLIIFQKFNGLSASRFWWNLSKRGISLLRCSRLSPANVRAPDCSWSYSGIPDKLCFSVNEDVMFYGVHLFGDPNGGKYHVTLKIKGVEVCGTFSSDFVRRERYSWYGFDVMLRTPIKIKRKCVVEVTAGIQGPPSYFCENGEPFVIAAGVEFMFSAASGPANGTDVTRGQFYEIIFVKVYNDDP